MFPNTAGGLFDHGLAGEEGERHVEGKPHHYIFGGGSLRVELEDADAGERSLQILVQGEIGGLVLWDENRAAVLPNEAPHMQVREQALQLGHRLVTGRESLLHRNPEGREAGLHTRRAGDTHSRLGLGSRGAR